MSNDMATFFDNLATDWENAPDEYVIRENLVSMMGLPPNSNIADVGCGKGVMLEHLLKTNPYKITAVDISGEMIRLAKEAYADKYVEFIHGNFFDIELPSQDAIIFFNSYPHFIDKDKLAKKVAQATKKGSAFIIAHSFGKAEINCFHTGKRVSTLSGPLEDAETEANKFLKYFRLDSFVDNEEKYFIKMIRR